MSSEINSAIAAACRRVGAKFIYISTDYMSTRISPEVTVERVSKVLPQVHVTVVGT